MRKLLVVTCLAVLNLFNTAFSENVSNHAVLTLSGDRKIKVEYDGKTAEITVPAVDMFTVTAEQYDELPLYNANGAAYRRGTRLKQVCACECSVTNAVDPNSVVIRSGKDANAITYEKEKDYTFEPLWTLPGRLPDGRIAEKQTVFIDYVYGKMRLDSIVQTSDKKIELRKGEPHVATPSLPEIADNETRIANIWVHSRKEKLSPDDLFPILETSYPESKKSLSVAEDLLPKTMKKLRNNETLRILAWGDSVTDASYLPLNQRWQMQFVVRLQERFPNAKIELTTEAWGGPNTDSYRAEPAGSPKNYKEKVLDLKPDLIISEFVNDAWMDEKTVDERYGKILEEFQSIEAEWIILTPHYVRPDWMKLNREKEIDNDTRPYTSGVRNFGKAKRVAVADAAARYGRLWRQGIPYSTLMMNNINHPNSFGMKLFADALMEVFPEK